MKRFLSEPLVHFVVLGGLLFAGYRVARPGAGADSQRIDVDAGRIEHLTATFRRTWQRPPSTAETKALIDQYVREEVLSREARKLGLDHDDVVIRRRLQQKMEFLADGAGTRTEPTAADLADYFARHSDAFRRDTQLTFRHIYLNPARHGDRFDAVVAARLAVLERAGTPADASSLGDPTLLEPVYHDEPQSRIEAAFGAEFAAELLAVPLGAWSGPLTSAFGSHLVLVEGREPGGVPSLDAVRDEVRREWENGQRAEANRKLVDALLQQYEVRVEWPASMKSTTATR